LKGAQNVEIRIKAIAPISADQTVRATTASAKAAK
jgi:hypothetical protein